MDEKQHVAYEGPAFTIEWYFHESGKSLALDYYKSLDANYRRKLLLLLKRMGDFGKINDSTKFNNEGDQIYAFKPQPERFLCFFVCNKKIIITNGFRKKQQKLPQNEKERALLCKQDYQKRLKAGTYYD